MGAFPANLSPFFQSLSEGVQVATGLRQAAQQQQEMEERKRASMADEQLRQAQLSHQQDVFGAQQNHQRFSDLLELLEKGAEPEEGGTYAAPPTAPAPGMPDMNGGRIPADPARTVSTGGRSFYVPTQDEVAKGAAARKAMEERATGSLVPTPEPISRGLYSGGGPQFVNPAALQGLQQTLQDTTTRKEIADARANPPEKTPAPKTTVSLTKKDARLLGMQEGAEVPIDEYKARTTMYSDQARADSEARARQPKPPTRQEYLEVEQRKQKAIADSVKQYDKDKADPLTSAADAQAGHIERLRNAQNAYEQELGALTEHSVGHNDWADKLTPLEQPPARDQSKAKPTTAGQAQAAAKPQYKVGDTVSYQGKPHKVTAITKEGKLVLQPK